MLFPYMFSGAILLTLGQQASLILFALLLILSSVSLAFVKNPERRTTMSEISMSEIKKLNIHTEIKNAFSIMTKTRKIYRSLFLLALTQTLVLIIAAITPGYATQVLHMNIAEFPLTFVTPAAIGMLIGAVILINRFHNVPKDTMIISGLFLSGVSMLVLPYSSLLTSKDIIKDINSFLPHFLLITDIHLVVVLAFILGLANSLVFVPANTILQENTTDDNRGKLYGLLNAIVGVFSLIPIIAVGGLSDLLGVSNVIVGVGICLLFIGGYEYFLHKD